MMSMFKLSVAAVTLAGVMAGAAPVAAQGFGFGFDDRRRAPFSDLLCANEFQVRQLIGRRGYTDISLNARQGRYIQARATRGAWVYLIQYDRCSKAIVDTTRLRRAR